MTKEFKQTFFTSLLVVLLIVSNLIGLKLTNFLDLTISVDFLTYPFTFLCTLLIMNMGGKKSAYQAVLISAVIQVFIVISYTLAVKLGTQTIIPDANLYVNEVFKVNELKILSSLIAFLVSHYVLIYIYDNFKRYGKELYGVVIGLLASLFLNATIYLVITLYNYDVMFIINMLLSNIIVSIIMVVIITILFYLLKEKEIEKVSINSMKIDVNNFSSDDKAIEDILITQNTKEPKKVVNKKKNTNSSYNKNNKSNKTSNKTLKKDSKTNTKKVKTSQSKVNKNDN